MKKFNDIYWFTKKANDFIENYDEELTISYFLKLIGNEFIGGRRVNKPTEYLEFLKRMNVIHISDLQIVSVTSRGKQLFKTNKNEQIYGLDEGQKKIIGHWVIEENNKLVMDLIEFYRDNLENQTKHRYLFPKRYQQLIEDLLYLGILELINDEIIINKDYHWILLGKKRKLISLENFKTMMQRQEIIGNIAEEFVMEYEINRLTNSRLIEEAKMVRRVSIEWANLGYDIKSFNSKSNRHNRFIEVKAINSDEEFYWTINEIDVAIKLGEEYFLYLVYMSNNTPKNIEIIQNPYEFIKNNAKMKPVEFKITLNNFPKKGE